MQVFRQDHHGIDAKRVLRLGGGHAGTQDAYLVHQPARASILQGDGKEVGRPRSVRTDVGAHEPVTDWRALWTTAIWRLGSWGALRATQPTKALQSEESDSFQQGPEPLRHGNRLLLRKIHPHRRRATARVDHAGVVHAL